MYGYIDGYDFGEMEPMRYFAPPSSWTDEKKRENARMKIYSGEFLGSQKFDGYFAKLIKDEDGNVLLCSRSRGVNGKFPDKHEWVPHLQPYFDKLPNGTCLLGELYLPSQPGSRNITTILGCLKDKAVARQNKGERLHFYVFDCLAWSGKSQLKSKFCQRIDALELMRHLGYEDTFVGIAKYARGADLDKLIQEVLASGGEGVVITRQDALYEPGKRPSKTTLKIKKELAQTIDCFFTGKTIPATRLYSGKEIEHWQYWEDANGKKICGDKFKDYCLGAAIVPVTKGHYYGWAGSLEIGVLKEKKGAAVTIKGKTYQDYVIHSIGWLSGLPDEMKANPNEFCFRPLEVSGMEWNPESDALRHGKMIGWRDDLTLADCTYDKIDV